MYPKYRVKLLRFVSFSSEPLSNLTPSTPIELLLKYFVNKKDKCYIEYICIRIILKNNNNFTMSLSKKKFSKLIIKVFYFDLQKPPPKYNFILQIQKYDFNCVDSTFICLRIYLLIIDNSEFILIIFVVYRKIQL